MKKLINIVLLVTLIFIGFGLNSNFNYVDADAGQYNQSRTLENLIINGDFEYNITGWLSGGTGSKQWDSGSLNSYNISSTYFYVYQSNLQILDHIYYAIVDIKDNNGNISSFDYGTSTNYNYVDMTNDFTTYSDRYTALETLFLIRGLGVSIMDWNFDNAMLFDLTEHYGSGNEPTLEEFEIILEDAPDYFDEWSYNYYEYDEYISDFSCKRYADNLIENGDFSTDSNSDGLADDWFFNYLVSSTPFLSNNIQYVGFDTDTSSFNILSSNVSTIEDNIYYFSSYTYNEVPITHMYSFYIGIQQNYPTSEKVIYNLDDNLWDETISILWTAYATSNYSFVYQMQRRAGDTLTDVFGLDNVMLFNLTAIYGKGNEPSQSEWELVLAENTVGYSDGFEFVDECWMEVEQTNPLYQYYSYIEGYNAEANLVFTETILEMDDIDPKYYITKYDLDMNYLGVIGTGFVTTSSVNAEGYTEHTLDYILPSPVVTEDGYIYLVYDKGGAGGKIIGGGYVFNEPSTNFLSAYTDDTIVVRTSYDAIGINDAPYIDVSDYQFDNDFDNYMFNDNDNFMITHFRINVTDYSNSNVSYLSENTDQHTIVDIDAVYEEFCDMSVNNVVPVDTYECYYYSSNDTELPSLLNYVDNNLTYSINLDSLIDVYNNSYINLLDDVGYADNLGVFSYGLRTNTTDLKISVGETPLYHFNYFYEMGLVNHQIRNGRNAYVDIYKPYNYLDSVLTYQYLYDNNTSIYEFDINDNEDQNILMDVFDGLTPEDATITYYLKNVDGVYNNGASEDAYDIYISDSYVMTEADPFPDKVDNWMEMLNMDSTLGNILIASLILIMVTIGMYIKTKNVIAVLFVDFIVISLLAVLGIIPLWIILVLIMMFFGGLFIKKRGQE